MLRWQRTLLYQPRPAPVGNWEYGERVVVEPANRQFFLCHGNYGCARDRRALAGIFGGGIYYFHEYAGFGSQLETAPTKRLIIQRAKEAVKHLRIDLPLYLIGESLGTGVVSELVGTLQLPQLRGVVLITPYTRMSELASRFLPLVGGWLLVDRYSCIDHLRHYDGKVVVVASQQDEIIPYEHAQRLTARPQSRLLPFKGGHNDAYLATSQWLPALKQYLFGEYAEAGGGRRRPRHR